MCLLLFLLLSVHILVSGHLQNKVYFFKELFFIYLLEYLKNTSLCYMINYQICMGELHNIIFLYNLIKIS